MWLGEVHGCPRPSGGCPEGCTPVGTLVTAPSRRWGVDPTNQPHASAWGIRAAPAWEPPSGATRDDACGVMRTARATRQPGTGGGAGLPGSPGAPRHTLHPRSAPTPWVGVWVTPGNPACAGMSSLHPVPTGGARPGVPVRRLRPAAGVTGSYKPADRRSGEIRAAPVRTRSADLPGPSGGRACAGTPRGTMVCTVRPWRNPLPEG